MIEPASQTASKLHSANFQRIDAIVTKYHIHTLIAVMVTLYPVLSSYKCIKITFCILWSSIHVSNFKTLPYCLQCSDISIT